MPPGTHRHRVLVLLGTVAVLLLAVLLIGERHLKGTLVHAFSVRTGRQVQIGGDLQAQLLSLHPWISAHEVSVGNPEWMPPGVTAEANLVTVRLEWHWAVPPLQIRRLEILGANLHLVRDAQGHANWHLHEEGPGRGPPLMHSLFVPEAHVELHDARRHLQFTGTVSAEDDAAAAGGAAPLRIEGAGQLNGRAASFRVVGDPLAGVSRNQAYHFKLDERSGAAHLQGQGALEHPFDFRRLQGSFQMRGPDLADAYYLVGLKLPRTAAFDLSGKLARRGTQFDYSALHVTTGDSDLEGRVAVDRVAGRTQVEAHLSSARLRLADLHAGAAGQPKEPAAPQPQHVLTIPDTPLQVARLKQADAVVTLHAGELDAGRLTLSDVTGKVSIDKGVVSVTGVQATLAGGALTGNARLDASGATVHGSLDMSLAGAQLEQLKRDPAAMGSLSGLMSVRAQLAGDGASLHDMAATAEGTVTAVVRRGTVRAALAEAASLELAGALGLMTHSQKQTGVRCAVASFDAHTGVLGARTVVVDTDKALITMTGEAQIATEALDFTLRGHPKTAALALRSAVAVGGTLAHPQFRLSGERPAVQAGAATALGVTLAPLAAVLAFVNPGLARDADCEGLIASLAPANPPPPAASSAAR